jgi:hypothetical protein
MLPAYTLRRLLLVVTLCGFVFLVPAMAARGYLWAIAAVVALGAGGVLLLIQALLYLAIRAVGDVVARRARSPARETSQP